MLVLSSEVGVLDIPPERIVKKSRVRSGQMLLVDTVQKRIIEDGELKEEYAARQPYGDGWTATCFRSTTCRCPTMPFRRWSRLPGTGCTRPSAIPTRT